MLSDIVKTEQTVKTFCYFMQGTCRKGRIPMRHEGRAHDGLIYIVSGQCTYHFDDGRSFTAKAEDLLYLAKGARYRMDVECEPYTHHFCDFDFCGDSPRRSFTQPLRNPDKVRGFFAEMANACRTTEPGKQTRCLSLLYRVYYEAIASATVYPSPVSHEKLTCAVALFVKRLAESELTVREAAMQVGVSEMHLRRLFHARYGVSPSQFLLSLRIERAKELLVQTALPLAELAPACGFSSAYYFCRAFRKASDMTPGSYRSLSCQP